MLKVTCNDKKPVFMFYFCIDLSLELIVKPFPLSLKETLKNQTICLLLQTLMSVCISPVGMAHVRILLGPTTVFATLALSSL